MTTSNELGSSSGVRSPLIGRDALLAEVLSAIADPDCLGVRLKGPAGSGKSMLATAALGVVGASGALTATAKFAEGGAQASFGPIMEAVTELIGRALDRLHDPEAAVAGLVQSLGPALNVLTEAGLRVDGVARQSAPALLGRREAVARIVDACLRLFQWLSGFETPMVLFVDDWPRSGPDGLSLIGALTAGDGVSGLTVLLADRADRGEDALVDESTARSFDLAALEPSQRFALLKTVLGDAASAVFDWFGEACPALPFDIIAAAKALESSGAIFEREGEWFVDPARAALLGRDDLARTLIASLRHRGAASLAAALGAALWGDRAPIEPLRVALGLTHADLESVIKPTIDMGILERLPDDVRFRHDRLRAAVLSMHGEAAVALAARMAERLLDHAAGAEPSIAKVTLRLRLFAGIEDACPDVWLDRFAVGAREARLAMDLDGATEFAEAAWRLRDFPKPRERASDRLLIHEAILAAADRYDAEAVMARLAALFGLSASPQELGDDYELAIKALRMVGRPDDAWRVAKEGLARLGLRLPERVTLWSLAPALLRWRLRQWLGTPRQTPGVDQAVDPLMKVGDAAGVMAYERSPLMSAFLALRGYEKASRAARCMPLWQANDTFLAAMLGDFERAARLGERAAAAADNQGPGAFARAATLYRALYWGVIWRRPQRSLRGRCRDIRDLALGEGDLIQAAVAIRNWVMIGWRTSPSLDSLTRDLRQAEIELARLGDRDVHAFVASLRTAVVSLTSPPDGSVAADMDSTPDRPAWAQSVSHDNALLIIELASVHRDWRYTREIVNRTPMFRANVSSHPRGADWRFHDAFARLKCGEPLVRSDMAYLKRAARLNPADNQAKFLAIRAEQLRRQGRLVESLAAYASVAELAECGDSKLEAGVILEAAAEAAHAAGEPRLAEDYDRRAQIIWRAWGANVKLPHVAHQGEPSPEALEELADARAKVLSAERVARARSRFLADVAHELRTPLQGMQGLLDLAADDPNRLDLASLRDVFGSLKAVVNDLTDFGALSSGEGPVELGTVDILELLKAECAIAAAFAKAHGASLELTVQESLPATIRSDGPRLRQVVRNLLSNAAKYGAGRIHICLEAEPSTPDGGEGLCITVDDEGPGLSPGDLVHIFEPFERGARAGDGLGLGLGLALSRRIALRLGGALQAENRPEGGARFTFRFPLERAPSMTERTAPAIDGRPLRILLAEDVPLVRRVIAAILQARGHEVTEADDGAEAAALLSAMEFDLAILDLGLPKVSGLDVARGLNGPSRSAPPPPVVLLTASADETIGSLAAEVGVARVLRKPVTADELWAVVDQVHDSASARSALRPYAAQFEALRDEAQKEVRSQISSLTGHAPRPASEMARDAHRLAGLAAQFGWPRIAAAADAMEIACQGDAPTPAWALDQLVEAQSELPQPAGG